jgi:WD40 repeat protein
VKGAKAHTDEVRLLELANGKEEGCMGLDGFVQSLTFSPDGRMLACGSYGQCCLVDRAKKEVRHHLPGLGQVAFAPDGKILSGTDRSRVRFFDTATGKELHDRPSSFSGIHEGVDQIAVSHDGRRLASIDRRQNALFIWDTASGRLVHRISPPREQKAWVQGLAFAPQGRLVLVCRRKGDMLRVLLRSARARQAARPLNIVSPQTPSAQSVESLRRNNVQGGKVADPGEGGRPAFTTLHSPAFPAKCP